MMENNRSNVFEHSKCFAYPITDYRMFSHLYPLLLGELAWLREYSVENSDLSNIMRQISAFNVMEALIRSTLPIRQFHI